MHRALSLLAIVGCAASDREPAPAAVHWVVAPPAPAWPIPPAAARLGRSEAPQLARREGIAGDFEHALRLPQLWRVPGDGPARAASYGLDGDAPAVELIDVDRGAIAWRSAGCTAPIVGVTAQAIVCGDDRGTRALGLDGAPRWQDPGAFVAMTDDRVIAAGLGDARVLDAATGRERARVHLPAGIASAWLVASCGDGRELYAATPDGRLARIADGKLAWAAPVRAIAVDPCAGASVLVTTTDDAGTALVALARGTGQPTGRIEGVRGDWPARAGGDRLEVATAIGVASWARDLAGPPVALALPPLGELLDARGERRLVRATPGTAVVLDRGGVRAYVPLAERAAVLGDDHVVAGSWLGAPGQHARRFGLPGPWHRALRVPPRRPGVAVPAELRDLPAVAPLDPAGALARGDALGPIAAIALDRDQLYVAIGAALARFDVAARAWSWLRGDGCPAAPAVALAAAADLVVCAAGGRVRATARDGAPRWDAELGEVDAVDAGGEVVLARAADRLDVLDARDGTRLATLASDDGAAVRAAAQGDLVIAYERGALVARLPRAGMLPAWSIAVDGVVTSIAAAGDGVLVALDDGDAFHVDPHGAIAALPGLGLGWRASGELILGDTAGEPVPPAVMPTPPKVIARPVPRIDSPENPPAIGTPWQVPPPGPAAWQLAMYETSGALHARDDYALAPPVAIEPRAAGAPIVVAYGPGAREVLAIDPRRGDPLRRRRLPDDAGPARAFSTVVDGAPVAGVVLANPLRVVLF
ncbi:MAG TPA: hypothetical protein VLX92_17315 [Kofleriaceae bacterium]|nr:hypothetical protein [Kofleriaceae bacterium]